MKTAILTGFQTFGEYVVNPTEILARSLDGKILSGHKIHPFVFPKLILPLTPSEDYGRIIVESALKNKISVIISLGLSSAIKGFRLERSCTNWVESDKYCSELENRMPIVEFHQKRKMKFVPLNRWDLPLMFEGFRKTGIPFESEISFDAGTYCCNALMYRVLDAMEISGLEIPFLFAHVPCTEESILGVADFDRQKTLIKQEQLKKGVEVILQSYVC